MPKLKLGSREKPEIEALERNASVIEWMKAVYWKRSRSLHTKLHYLRRLNSFCKFMGMSPDELVRRYREDDGVYVESKLDEFIASEIDQGHISQASCIYNSVKSFFKHQKPRIELKTEAPQREESYLDQYRTQPTEEQFKRLMDYAGSLRNRFLFSFLRQTGVRVGWAIEMRLKHILDLEIKDDGELILKKIPPAIDVYPESREHYITFLAKDGCELMMEYLRSRQKGRLIWSRVPTKNGKVKMASEHVAERLNPESPLFIKEQNRPKGTWNHPLSPEEIQYIFRFVCAKAGLPKFSPHSLRRMFMNSLERAGIHTNRIEAMMGHLHGVRAVYSAVGRGASLEQKIEELREDYAKAEPQLALIKPTISPKEEFLGFVRARAKELGIDIEEIHAMKWHLSPEDEYIALEEAIAKKRTESLVKDAFVKTILEMKEKGLSDEAIMAFIDKATRKEHEKLEKELEEERKKAEKPKKDLQDCKYELVDESQLLALLNQGLIDEDDIIKEVNGKTLIRRKEM